MNEPRIVVASICLMAFLPHARAGELTPSATLEVHGDAVQPGGAPVLLELVVRNTGPVPISYWCGGPGDYPDAAEFLVTISRTDRASRPGRGPLSNGQDSNGAGRAFTVAPGRTLRFPAAVQPLLPAGEYDLAVECEADGRMHNGAVEAVTWPAMHSANVFHVKVREDHRLLAARDADVVAKVRAHEPFARHVSSTWPRTPVRAELLKDLTGDDIVAADRAADGLWGDRAPPGTDEPLVARVILKHLAPPKDGTCDIGLMSKLLRPSPAPKESAELLAAIAKLALARADGPVRDRATAALGLRGTSVPNQTVEATLAAQRAAATPVPNAAYLNALLGLFRSEDVAERRIAYRGLAEFRGNPAAITAARAGLLDADAECRREAGATLALIVAHPTTRSAAP